jgi:glycosyltransferase involved in cell wall biosynthesis
MSELPSLSVVIPVYNEPEWIFTSVGDVVEAIHRSPFDRTEIVIVDDGSEQETRDALERLDTGDIPLRVLHQSNQGRLPARKTGMEAATGDLVLLLDSRVSIRPGSLAHVAGRLRAGERGAWNAHVDIEVKGNPYARFWHTITVAAYPDYLRNPRPITFGAEDYDRYPKGTTCFLAPREALLEATRSFASMYEDMRFANDDTHLLRPFAERHPIHIDPGFSCLYRSRDALPKFLRHTLHRGTVFVDGFGRPGTRFFPVLAAFYPSTLAYLWLLRRRPVLALSAAALVPAAAGAGATALRRPPADVAAFAGLSLPFAVIYSLGIWRGLLLALRARWRG